MTSARTAMSDKRTVVSAWVFLPPLRGTSATLTIKKPWAIDRAAADVWGVGSIATKDWAMWREGMMGLQSEVSGPMAARYQLCDHGQAFSHIGAHVSLPLERGEGLVFCRMVLRNKEHRAT